MAKETRTGDLFVLGPEPLVPTSHAYMGLRNTVKLGVPVQAWNPSTQETGRQFEASLMAEEDLV